MRAASILLAAMLLAVSGCATPTGTIIEERVIAPWPPPAERVEVIPAPPANEVVAWQPGHWHWNSADYAWVSGRYVQQPSHYHAWAPGRWAARGGAWEWTPGHWR